MAKHVESDQRVPWHLRLSWIAGDRCPGPCRTCSETGTRARSGNDRTCPEVLSSLYHRRKPDAIHAVRDEAYYRWRFASPGVDPADVPCGRGSRDGGCARQDTDDSRGHYGHTSGGHRPADRRRGWETAVSSLLNRAIVDHRDSDLLSIPEGSGSAGDTAPTGISAGQPTPPVPVFGERFGSVCPAADGRRAVAARSRMRSRSRWVAARLRRTGIPFDPSERGCASRPSSEARPRRRALSPRRPGP